MTTPYQEFSELRPAKKIVANLLKDKGFDSILEVGCQWGENLVAIKDRFPDKKIVGIDANWDNILEEARTVTGLDIRLGSVYELPFKDKEFDVVFTNALFCMLAPNTLETGFKEILRVAKKYVILIELDTDSFVGISWGDRTGANWVNMFKKYGLTATKEKIPEEVWSVNPWLSKGYIYYAEVGTGKS